MKVALVYPHIGGTDGYALDFARLHGELSALGVDTLSVANPDSVPDGLRAKVSLLTDLGEALRSVDVVHFVGFFFPEYLGAWRRVVAARVPYVISPLSNLQCFALERSWQKKRLFLALGGSGFLRGASAIHSFGSSETESALNLGYRGDIFEIPLGAHLPESADGDARSGERWGEMGDYVLFFGRLDVFQKGLDILIEGYERYASRNPDGLKLVIAGRSWRGSSEWLQKRIAELPSAPRIRFVGETTEAEKLHLMRGARALIYPSRFDGPPRPLRDAIAQGVFVLASRQSNICPELESRKLGLYFDANRNSLAQAIEAVEARVCTLDPQVGRSILDWRRVAGKYAQMYAHLAAA